MPLNERREGREAPWRGILKFLVIWLVERDNPFKPDIANSTVSFDSQAAECDRRIPILDQNDVVSLSGGYSAVVNSAARQQF